MKRILYTTDYSRSSEKAFEYALEIARCSNHGKAGEIVLMHAFQFTYLHPDLESESYDMLHDDTAKRLQILIDAATRDLRYADITFTIASMVGRTIPTILEAINIYHPDMVVMASSGSSEAKTFLGGSPTNTLFSKINIPMLVIPADAELTNFRNFILASDYEPIQHTVLDNIKELSASLNANVTVVHVAESVSDLSMVESAQGIRLDRYLGEEFHHRFHFVEDDDVMEGLNRFIANKADAGLLIMISHKRHDWLERLLMPSHTKAMLKTGQVPLLLLKDKT
jgi:nucleotide-binding universal stress UspA family protein